MAFEHQVTLASNKIAYIDSVTREVLVIYQGEFKDKSMLFNKDEFMELYRFVLSHYKEERNHF